MNLRGTCCVWRRKARPRAVPAVLVDPAADLADLEALAVPEDPVADLEVRVAPEAAVPA